MKIFNDFDLKDVLWYKIGGKTRYFIEVVNKQDIKEAFAFLKKEKVDKVFFLGLGSNIIFSQDIYDGAIIKFVPPPGQSPSGAAPGIRLLKPHVIQVDAGVVLDDVIKFAFDNNLVGLEWAGGLPGDTGAAIRGNVGAFGGEIKDVVAEAETFEIVKGKPKFKILKKFELKFSYRNSQVKKKKLGVTSATFRLKKANETEMLRARSTYLQNAEYRRVRHPLEFPNCGSVFKNVADPIHVAKVIEVFPDIAEKIKRDWHGKVSMGYLIKRLNFSEYRVGNAMVSPKHCNFIVNLGDAKATDVLSIIKTIQEKFIEVFDFMPEVEVEIV